MFSATTKKKKKAKEKKKKCKKHTEILERLPLVSELARE